MEIAAELDGIQLGDQRLNRRSKQLLEALAANPEASVNGACEGWGDTNAAYRFFRNESVTPEKILQPHYEATARRIREQPVVLVCAEQAVVLSAADNSQRALPRCARCKAGHCVLQHPRQPILVRAQGFVRKLQVSIGESEYSLWNCQLLLNERGAARP